MGGGHYVAYALNPNDKWYCFDDSHAQEVSEERVGKENGYLLFYRARDIGT